MTTLAEYRTHREELAAAVDQAGWEMHNAAVRLRAVDAVRNDPENTGPRDATVADLHAISDAIDFKARWDAMLESARELKDQLAAMRMGV